MDTNRRRWEFIKDIVVPVIIGFCSIVVAISANQIAKSSNETARLQALIAKNAEAPTIYVYRSSDSQFGDSIKVSVSDGRYSNLAWDVVSFMEFTFCHFDRDSGKWMYDRVDIPISHFSASSGSKTSSGEELIIFDPHDADIEECADFYKNYYLENRPLDADNLRVYDMTYLKCTYLDLLNEEENVFFQIGPTGLVSWINPEEGEAKFQRYEEMKNSDFDLSRFYHEEPTQNLPNIIDAINAAGDLYKDPVTFNYD